MPADAPALLPLLRVLYRAHSRPDNADAVGRNLADAVDPVLRATIHDRAFGLAGLRILRRVESDVPFAELPA